jgi:hypothetical protein
MTENKCITEAHELALKDQLPADFNDWTLANKNGWIVAHVAACRGHLPADFKDWPLAENITPADNS